MAKRGFSTFGARSRFNAKYNIPRDPVEGDTIFIKDFENTQDVMMYFVDPDDPTKNGEWLTGHYMHMYEGSAGSGVVSHSILTVNGTKDLGLAECPTRLGEQCIGTMQPLFGNGVPNEDDVCGVAISGIWEAIFASGTPILNYFATVSSTDAGEGDDISSAGTARIGIWTDNDSTYASLWHCGMERS